MRSVHKFLALAFLVSLIFATIASAAKDLEPNNTYGEASSVNCEEPPFVGEISPGGDIDFYAVQLVAGQVLKIDVDTEGNVGTPVDTVMEFYDISGAPLDIVIDDQPAPDEGREKTVDPYHEFVPSADGIYFVSISSYDANASGSYTIFFEFSCSPAPPPPEPAEIAPGDLLASIRSTSGSLISIDLETGEGTIRSELGQFGPVNEIEFHSDGTLFGATAPLDEFNGAIIIINPDTGEEVLVGQYPPGEVRVLEFVDETLYGFYLDASDGSSKLVTIDQSNGSFISEVEVPANFGPVQDLAFDPVSKVLYGLNLDELFVIEIVTDPNNNDKATATRGQSIPIEGLLDSEQVTAIEFDQNGTLSGATWNGNVALNLVTIDPATGKATVVGSIVLTTVSTTSSLTADSPAVSALTFVPGDEDQTYETTLCSSTLANSSPFSSRLASSKFIKSKHRSRVRQPAVRLFKFQGTQAELLTIKLTLEEAEPAVESADEVVANVDSKNKAFLGLRHTSWWVDFRKRAKGPFPLEIGAELPEDGWYRLVVMQPMRRHLRKNYCLTVESQDPNSVALETLDVAQLRDLWSLKTTTQTAEEAVPVEPQTVSDSDSTKITTSASIGATSVESTGTTAVEPAEDGTEVFAEDGRTAEVDDDNSNGEGNTVNTEDPVDQDDGPAADGRTEEVDDDSGTAEGNTVNTEESLDRDDGPADDDGRTEEVDDDSNTTAENTVNTEE